jgi:hypothetical protein
MPTPAQMTGQSLAIKWSLADAVALCPVKKSSTSGIRSRSE